MDKILAIIIIFLGISFLMAGILAMGAVPKIFQTGEETTNQTEIIIKHFERENNTTNKLLNSMNQSLVNEDKAIRNQGIMIEKLNESLQQNLNISKEHQTVAKDHDSIQTIQGRLLQNLTEELKEIKTLHKEIKQEIESINSNPIS
jgi:membrane glycosyltransferase